MSETPKDRTPEQEEALEALTEVLGHAVFGLLSDETFTEDETESFLADTYHVAYLTLGAFDPQILSTETTADGSKKFTIEMTVPDGDTLEVFKSHFQDVPDYDYDEDDEDDEEEEDEEE
jgi:hypothetical protein